MDLSEEFNEIVRKKYKLLDQKQYMELDYKERNKQLYDVLTHYKICVVPSEKIESFDKLPHFMIIESNLRDLKKMIMNKKKLDPANKVQEAFDKKKKLSRFDPRNVKGNIELF